MDALIYDSARLACSAEEKEACLETVAKLARLCKYVRGNGPLLVSFLAKEESDPFLRTCLWEFGEAYGDWDGNETEVLTRIFGGYLAAGNYRGGAFLNAVLVVKGLLLLLNHVDVPPSTWGKLLSAELRGFFGVEYQERVAAIIKRETKTPNTREASFIPEFDRFVQLNLPQRQALLQETEAWPLAMALRGASAAAENALLEALTDEARKTLEENLEYTTNPFASHVTRAQEDLLNQWGLVKPGEVLEPSIPESEFVKIE